MPHRVAPASCRLPEGRCSSGSDLWKQRNARSRIYLRRKPDNWGQGLTVDKMKECVWAKPQIVAEVEFLEWSVLQKHTDKEFNMN